MAELLIDLSGLGAEVSVLASRLEQLNNRSRSSGHPAEDLVQVLTELQLTVEELRTSYEELSAQNEALLDSWRRLEDQHARYRSLFEAAPVPYAATDLRGVVQGANRAAAELLGVAPRFLEDKPISSFVSLGHRSEVHRAMAKVATTHVTQTGEWDVQPRRRPPVRAEFVIVVLLRDGVADALLWLLHDLTTVKSLEQRAGQLTAELSRLEAGEDDELLRAVDLAAHEVTSRLLDETPLSSLLSQVAVTARRVLPGAVGAAVSVIEQGRPREVGVTAPWVTELDERQYTLQEGPSLQALSDGGWHASGSLDEESRWPRWAAFAEAQGTLAVLSVPLVARGARMGVLDLYGADREAFSGACVMAAQRLADAVGVPLANALLVTASRRMNVELEQALVSRSTVDMAKGILMARLGLDPDGAFDALRSISQRRHVKLRDLAVELVRERKA
jgi:PAS domain S-box-containing protein